MKEIYVSDSKGDLWNPGHWASSVEVAIERRKSGRWKCTITSISENCGNGEAEEESVVGRGDSLDVAIAEAKAFATEAGFESRYLAQVLSAVADAAETEAEKEIEA